MVLASSGVHVQFFIFGGLFVLLLGQQTTVQSDQKDEEDWEHKYYLGNAVPRRDVPPPTNGCTVVGKVFLPLSPDPALPYSHRVGWDWCQSNCRHSYVSGPSGTLEKCSYFAFYPDGKCFLQGRNAILASDTACNSTNPCEHGFQVISGPASCENQSHWVTPPSEISDVTQIAQPSIVANPSSRLGEQKNDPQVIEIPATHTASSEPANSEVSSSMKSASVIREEGESCNGSLPPAYATLCRSGLTCVANSAARGADGICKNLAIAKRGSQGDVCSLSEPSQAGMLCADDLRCVPTLTSELYGDRGVCNGDTDSQPHAPVVSVVTKVTESTTAIEAAFRGAATTGKPATTSSPVDTPPAGATIIGYYYEPHSMPGTGKTFTSSWRDCMKLCASNPYCEHFGYWPDNGCHQQGSKVTLTEAVCDATLPSCPGSQVISGPRDLADTSLWPVFEDAMPLPQPSESGSQIVRKAPATGEDAGESTVDIESKRPSVNVLSFLTFCVLIGGLSIAYVWNKGLLGGDDTDSETEMDDVQERGYETMSRPLTRYH